MKEWAGRYASRMSKLVFATYGDTCWLCGHPGADTVDHVLPRHHGGTHDLANLRPAHGRKRPALGCPGNYGRPCPLCRPRTAKPQATSAPGW